MDSSNCGRLTVREIDKGFSLLSQIPANAGESKQVITPAGKKMPGRNAPCYCGSGVKYKKCCRAKLRAEAHRSVQPSGHRPQEKPYIAGATVEEVSQQTEPPSLRQITSRAMLRAGVAERVVWAYFETGLFITEAARSGHSAENIEKWDAACKVCDETPGVARRVLGVAIEDS